MKIIIKILLGLAFTLILSPVANTQDFAPVGASWKIRGWVDSASDNLTNCEVTECPGNFIELRSEYKATIENKTCSIIYFYKGETKDDLTFTHDSIILHEDNNKIYFYQYDSFHLMLDFNLTQGDTLFFNAPGNFGNQSIKFNTNNGFGNSGEVISSIAVINESKDTIINSQLVKLIRYKSFLFDPRAEDVGLSTSLSKFGNIGGFFGDPPWHIADGCFGEFLCYQDSSFTYSTYHNCECKFQDIITANNSIPNTDITIYPNPASNTLYLKGLTPIKSQQIKIYDIQGNLISTFSSTSNEIDISTYKNGVYFIMCGTKENTVTSQFIKL